MEHKEQRIYEFGPFVLDAVQHLLVRGQEPVPLTPKTYDTLLVLVENSGRMLSKDELMKALWPESFVEESNLTVQISMLRKALGGEHRYIVTVPGRGYRFDAQVKERQQGGGDVIVKSHGRAERPIGELDDASRGGWATAGNLALHAVPRTQASPTRPRRIILWLAIGCAILAASLLLILVRPPMPSPRALRYTQITSSGRVDTVSKIVTDGARVYFAAHPIGRRTLVLNQASVDGAETAGIPIPLEEFFLCAISPDRSELLIAGSPQTPLRHPLWVLSVLGGSPHRVGDITAFDADWTPDGRIVYSVGAEVYIVKPDGTSPRKLLTTPGFASGFRWSPGGGVLRFTVSDRSTGSDSLWEASLDGSHLHPVLPRWNDPPNESSGAWTPDGKYYLFQSMRDEKSNIWALREKWDLFHKKAGNPVLLTTGPWQLSHPTLSPDGKRLFVVSEQHRGELARYEAKSSEFISYLPGLSAHRLSFTNDGQWLAYTTYPDGDLWRSRADGSQKLRLSFAPVHADLPRWSPDGKRIVFMASQGGKPADIYLIPADGAEPQRLLPQTIHGADPDWSNDGASVVFGPQPTFPEAPSAGGEAASAACAIRVVDLKTGRISNLSDATGLYWPRWSPKGNYVAALSIDTHRLMLFSLGARKWTELARGETLHNPLWSPDGKSIYFQDLGALGQPIYRVEIGRPKLDRIAGSERIGRPDIVYSAFTGLTPDGSPVVLLIHGLYDIYRLDLALP